MYFAAEMLDTRDDSLEGKVCLVSGSGNVAQYTVEKLLDMGAKPVTLCDSSGFIYDPAGIDYEKLHWVMELKNVRRGRMSEYAEQFTRGHVHAAQRPRRLEPHVGAFPRTARSPARARTRSTPRTLRTSHQRRGIAVSEGANMPTEPDGVEAFIAPASSTGPARQPTRAAWRSADWR